MTWTERDLPGLGGTVALVTGANSGIGLATSAALAAAGARVVLACRSAEHGRRAAERIRRSAVNSDVSVTVVDLSCLQSVRALAEEWTGPLDLLINNAGVMAPPKRQVTADGYELQFGTNHLGHFVLTGSLLPALLRSPAPRVVTVASLAHHGGDAGVVDGNAGTHSPQQAYRNSKLANLLFSLELQRQAGARALPLVSTAAHPGVAATGLVPDREGMGSRLLVRTFAPAVLRLFTAAPRPAARAVLYAATVAEPGSYTGPQRWGETRGAIGPARLSPLAQDAALARRLWDMSEDVTGLRYPWPEPAAH